MTKTERNAFRKALEAGKSQLGSENGIREALAIETSSDELDRTQDANDRDYAMSQLERNFNRLRETRAALRRLDADTFGICAGCEENIHPKRLAAVPWTSFCIECQEAFDCEEQTPRAGIGESLILAA